MKRGYSSQYDGSQYSQTGGPIYKRRRTGGYSARKRIENNALSAPQMLAMERIATNKAKRIVRGMAEKKYFQGNSGTQSVDNNVGMAINVFGSGFTRGDTGLNTFDGNRVSIDKATFRWTWDFTTTEDETAALYSSCRFLIVQGRGDIVDEVDADVGYFLNNDISGIFAQLSPLRSTNIPNFKVLYDSGPQSASTSNGFVGALGTAWSGEVTLYRKNFSHVFFNSVDPIVVAKNPVYLVAITDSAVTPHPIFHCIWDIHFTDDI